MNRLTAMDRSTLFVVRCYTLEDTRRYEKNSPRSSGRAQMVASGVMMDHWLGSHTGVASLGYASRSWVELDTREHDISDFPT